MIRNNGMFLIIFIMFLFLFLNCNKNNQYPQRFKNIPTGTSFFYGPFGNFYILPDEQLDSLTYRINIYNDSTGKYILQGIFSFNDYLYNPKYNTLGLDKNILFFNNKNKIFVKGLKNDTLILLLEKTLYRGQE